jgi:pectinesterase
LACALRTDPPAATSPAPESFGAGAAFLERRAFLAGAAACIASPVLATTSLFDAVVGTDLYPTVQAAIDAAPATGRKPFRILVPAGTWREKLRVASPFVQLIGAGQATTRLVFGDHAGAPQPGEAVRVLRDSATLTVTASDFAAADLTVENDFDYVGNLIRSERAYAGGVGLQGLAVSIAGESDRSSFERVALVGHQDTLFANAGRAAFRDCVVSGSVDFIFGAGRAWFERCEIRSRHRPGFQRNHGFITAPSTPRAQPFGLVFADCRLLREPLVPPGSVVLGRPWRPGRRFADGTYGDPEAMGAAAFLRCWMDAHISADGWDEMGYAARDGTRIFLQPDAARLAEFASRGPGAFRTRRRRWLTAAAARGYTRDAVLAGWRPDRLQREERQDRK